ncbi:MAG: site-2 protease family protein [Thermoprotei archaeon]
MSQPKIVVHARRYPVSSATEIRDIIIAWVALSSAFLIAERGQLIRGGTLFVNLFASLTVVGSGFILHEMMHKFVARRYGFWAEFRLWMNGLLLALLTSLIGVVFAAPGATYISAVSATRKENGVISLAGPATNIVVAVAYTPLLFSSSLLLAELGGIGLSINLFLAAFNMIPIMPLDGAKVFRWNKPLWAIVFVCLVASLAYLFLGL